MTDTFSIGQFTVDENDTAPNQHRWTLTTGKHCAIRHFYSTGTVTTVEQEKKIPRFAFLKISETTHLAHLRLLQHHYATHWQPQKSQILPALRKITNYDLYICTLIEA
ncbi:MAG: hypothetical protein HND27_03750 [Bacteroidetes bacterium]|nr:hypothetical protein [Bacteroidota bacterium]